MKSKKLIHLTNSLIWISLLESRLFKKKEKMAFIKEIESLAPQKKSVRRLKPSFVLFMGKGVSEKQS